jgi:NAD(P)H dehydrogenase (quinone)
LKGWLDKIFALGVVWDGDHRYEKGLLRGKQVLVVTGAGDSETAYAEQGMHGATIVQHLYPLLHSTLAHAGLDVLKPFIAHGLTSANDDERRILLENLEQYLSMWSTKPEYIYKHG